MLAINVFTCGSFLHSSDAAAVVFLDAEPSVLYWNRQSKCLNSCSELTKWTDGRVDQMISNI